jgi:murein L,D-transpeptidase YafK
MKYIILSILTISILFGKYADFVLVKKSERKLYLYSNGTLLKEYNIVLGGNTKGPKVQEGDKKTPEGTYWLDYKNSRSRFYRSIHISYPNKQDIANAKKLGVNPGGNIMIHGEVPKSSDPMLWFKTVGNWTAGCIALSNKDMQEFWELIKIPTKIEIKP